MKVGDLIKYGYAGAYWTGWILGIDKVSLYGHKIATVWRPDAQCVILRWPLDKSRIQVISTGSEE